MPIFSSNSATLESIIRSTWETGLVADFLLTPDQALSGWTVEFEYTGEIVNIWNAQVISRTGDRYVVQNVDYNSDVAAGATTGFGFQGSGPSHTITPIAIAGETLDGGTGTAVPTVSIADAIASEEDGSISFDLTLSAPASSAVTIGYQTVAGTAQAGGDFAATQAQIVIPAGQTSATITIPLIDDATPEAIEAFTIQLVSADGAAIADGSAIGRISDTDTQDPGEPSAGGMISVADASTVEGDPGDHGASGSVTANLIVDGPLTTSGNQILDANGAAVQIRAVNWFGAENDVRAPHGLWQRSLTDMMDQMVAEGFNAIRLPFSVQNILEDLPATSVAGDPSLQGLTTLQIFDRIIDYAEQIGIKVILDAHRVTQGNGAEGIWYSGQYDETDWISAWQILATRYGESPAVIGADLLNEPHLGTWGTGNRNDWAQAAEQAGNAVLDVAPNWLILVEGIGSYQGNGYWWGGQLQGVRDRPVVLDVDNKLVYSPHDYPASIFNQTWFNDGSNLFDVFRQNWGFIFEEDIAPILLGEFGSRLENPADQPWAEAITAYLSGDFNGDGVNDLDPGQTGPSFAWWSWNPNSGDTGGYVQDDWITVRQNAADLLDPLLDASGAEDGAHHGATVAVTFDVVLDAPAVETMSYTYETRDGTATAGEDYVAATGTISFAPGQQSAQVQVQVLPDVDPEDDETFSLVLTAPDGTDVTATGTIINDDGDTPTGSDPTGPGHGGHVHPTPPPSTYVDITTYGSFHGSSSHTGHDDLHGGRTAITTEAMVAYNTLRNFLGLQDAQQEAIGQWAFDNRMTNNTQAYGQDLLGVGLYYAMQGAKVGWIDDAAFDPQILADIQRTARLGDPADVMAMVEAHGHSGFAAFLTQHDLFDVFLNTLKMEPHYGGWMHGRVHGHMGFPDGSGGSFARAHDVNHLTVLSHDQQRPFMNDTFDWPQWSALDVPHQDVIDYFQSMVVLGDPLGDALPAGFVAPPGTGAPADPDADNDLNGDGTSDILWLNAATSELGYFQMQGGAASWQSLGFAGSGYKIEGIGDFNGDTVGDILWFNTQTLQVGLYEMADDGSYAWRSLGQAGTAYEIVGTGDFSGDGIDDILWHNSQTQQIGFYEMSADTFSWKSLGLAGAGYQVAGTGDFDGDGTDDILWLNTATRQLGVYEMEQGAFTWRSLGFAGQDYEVHGIGDFNGDGTDDVLWFNTATLQVGFYAMSETDFVWESLGFAGADYFVAGTGDFDDNGHDDIFWHNDATSQIGIYSFDAGGFQWNGLGVAGADFETQGMMPG